MRRTVSIFLHVALIPGLPQKQYLLVGPLAPQWPILGWKQVVVATDPALKPFSAQVQRPGPSPQTAGNAPIQAAEARPPGPAPVPTVRRAPHRHLSTGLP